MKINIRSLVGLTGLFVLGAGTANAVVLSAAPTINPVTGHYYEVVGADGISWNDAKAAVDSLPPFMGVNGHLATITSAGEDAFVESIRAAAKVAAVINRHEVWVGGLQMAGSVMTKGEGWIWDTGEGAISTPDVPLPSYSNWLPVEPNDNSGPGSENWLAVGLGGQFGWNDEGAFGNIGGYVVEYDVPREAEDCSVTAGGCETIAGQTLVFPEGSIPAGASISFNAFEFADDPARCGVSPLVLFDAATDPNEERPDLIIPPYLCGSPNFVVVAVDSSELDILEGTVFVENDTPTVLPGNDILVCEDPIAQNFPAEGDPQFQDVVVWQSTDPNEMLEVDPGVGGTGQFAGAAGEFTNECGSSRGRVRGASYYVVGLHIDFGPGYTWAGNTSGNFDKFVELTRYKMLLLKKSVRNAKIDRAISRHQFRILNFFARKAIRHLDRGRYRISQLDIQFFLWFVDVFNYQIIAGKNHNGEHLMRGSNIEFMLDVKVIPYAP